MNLLESNSPLCPLSAFVVEDNDCAYLFLCDTKKEQPNIISCCWIANYSESKNNLKDEMLLGLQPKMEAQYISGNVVYGRIKPEKLTLVWSICGSACALFYNDELLSVVSYMCGSYFPGYSKNLIERTEVGFPFTQEEYVYFSEKFAEANCFWKKDCKEEWTNFQTSYLQTLAQTYNCLSDYYAIDGGRFPARGLAVFDVEETYHINTIGMSLFHQPSLLLEENRVELCCSIAKELLSGDVQDMYKMMSGVCESVYRNYTLLQDGLLISFPVSDTITHALLISSHSLGRESLFEKEMGFQTLYIVPVSQKAYIQLQDISYKKQVMECFKRKEMEFRFGVGLHDK